jgi:glycolate oxidase FAD binding subunit
MTESSADRRVAEQVRDAAQSGDGLRILGAGTWLDAGHPVRATRTLSLADDHGVVAYSPGDLTITVRAGTTLAEIADALRAHDQWLALDPEGGSAVTIGATVATGSYGPAAGLYGTVRDQLLGMTVVTGRGEIVRPGGRVVKNVAGFDLTRLMTGAWGSLGVITEVTLRVRSTGLASGSVAHLARIMPARSGYREPVMLHERLASVLKRTFDPAHVLNPGIMGETVGQAGTTTAGEPVGARA